jgi:hypothetical protein
MDTTARTWKTPAFRFISALAAMVFSVACGVGPGAGTDGDGTGDCVSVSPEVNALAISSFSEVGGQALVGVTGCVPALADRTVAISYATGSNSFEFHYDSRGRLIAYDGSLFEAFGDATVEMHMDAVYDDGARQISVVLEAGDSNFVPGLIDDEVTIDY